LPDKPSIAVLPFQNMSGDSEQEYFADGRYYHWVMSDCIIRCSIGPQARSRPPQDTFMEHSDILVVGAGSAGAAMAARLSEEPTLRVTLVEAGSDTVPGEVPDDIKDIFPRSFLNSDYFWPNLTASLADGDAARPFPQARVVGGGSSVMGMIALRGLPSDYDSWEARGARNWGWRDVLLPLTQLLFLLKQRFGATMRLIGIRAHWNSLVKPPRGSPASRP